jgi:hypothetical protein
MTGIDLFRSRNGSERPKTKQWDYWVTRALRHLTDDLDNDVGFLTARAGPSVARGSAAGQ